VFFGGRLMVDEERILDIIDRMRVAVPEELKQARRVISEQERLIGEAQAQVRQAMEEQGLLAAVEAERARLIEQAERDAAAVRAGADDYARQVLEELEQRLTRLVARAGVGRFGRLALICEARRSRTDR
jgi:cell division septum initiation protein DivIVA